MKTLFHFTIDCDWIPNSEKSLPKLFEIIEKHKIKPTFFLTGKFAEYYKEFVDEMRNRDYEIGCHGLNHGLNAYENFGDTVSYSDQKNILLKSTEIIEKVSGIRPILFRAPRLQTSEDTFNILAELNYKIDSSIPVRRFDFGLGCINSYKYILKRNFVYYVNNSILEVSPSAFILPLNMRLLRIFNVELALLLTNIIRLTSSIIVFYLHPAEFLSINELEYPHKEKYFYETCGIHNFQILESFLTKVLDQKIQFERMSVHLAT